MLYQPQGRNQTIFDRLYLVFLTLLPLIYFGKIVDPVLIPRQFFLTGFTLIISCIIYYKIAVKKLEIIFSFIKLRVFLFICIFILCIIISFFQSVAITESYYFLSKIGIEITFYIITTFLIIQNELNINVIIKSVWIFSLILILLSFSELFQLLSDGNTFSESILGISATSGHKNLLASILFLTLPFTLYLFTLQKKWKIISITTIAFITIIIWLIQTKAVIISLFIFFCALFFLHLKHLRKKELNSKSLIIIGISLLTFVIFISIQYKNSFPRLFDTKSTYERINLWRNSSDMIQENFIFGVGAGNWQVIFPKYGLDKFSDPQVNNGLTTFQRPHNDFLWVLSEMGAIGLIAYIAIFIIITRYLFKLIKHHKSGNWNYLYTLFIATIAGYCCIMLLDFPLERIEHQILLYLVFSIITAQFYKAFPLTKKINQPTFKSLVPIFIFGTILFSFLVSFKRFSGEVHSNKLYHFKQKNNWLKVIKESNKATNTFYSIDPMSMPLEWYKGNALYNLGKIKEAEISFEKAQSIHPYNIHILNNLASCYENLNNHKKAVKTYNKALSISSNFEEARLNLSAVYYNQKKYEMAFKTIDLCPINSTNKKYKKFLPTILASWLNELKSKQKNNLIINTPSDSKTISQVYFESKEKSIKFEEFLSKKYN